MAPLSRSKAKKWCLYVSSFLVLLLPPASAVALTIFLNAAFGNYHPRNPADNANYRTVEITDLKMKSQFTGHGAGDTVSDLNYFSFKGDSVTDGVDSQSLSEITVQEVQMKEVEDLELNAQEKKELVDSIRDLYRILVQDSLDEKEKREEKSLGK